jgi:hypothetical protein
VVVCAVELTAAEPLAMILPVPVKEGGDPKEFKFINLAVVRGFSQIRTPDFRCRCRRPHWP